MTPLLALVACGGAGDAAPGTLTAGEQAELNDAAAMLEDDAMDTNAVLGNAS